MVEQSSLFCFDKSVVICAPYVHTYVDNDDGVHDVTA